MCLTFITVPCNFKMIRTMPALLPAAHQYKIYHSMRRKEEDKVTGSTYKTDNSTRFFSGNRLGGVYEADGKSEKNRHYGFVITNDRSYSWLN